MILALSAPVLTAQQSVRVKWPLVDILVRGDTGRPLVFAMSPNLWSQQGTGDAVCIEWLHIDPIDALQWAQVMQQSLDSVEHMGRRAPRGVLNPVLPSVRRHSFLAIGVDPSAPREKRLFFFQSDSSLTKGLRVEAPMHDVRALLAAFRSIGGWVVQPTSVPPRPPDRCPVPTYDEADAALVADSHVSTVSVPRISYPEDERVSAQEGRVWVQFVVDAHGDVDDQTVCVLLSDSPAFTRAVLSALPQARYRAATKSGTSVAELVIQEFRFLLRRR